MKRLSLIGGALLLAAGVAPAQNAPCPPPPPPGCATPGLPGTALPPIGTLPGTIVYPGTGLPGTGLPGTGLPGSDPGMGTTPGLPGAAAGAAAAAGGSVAGGGGEGGSGSLASAAPNMIGDFLGSYRSLSFIINRDGGSSFINDLGTTNSLNPKIAENNSPLPRDRVGFRYNYFSNALSITGLSNTTVPAPDLGTGRTLRATQTRDYDLNQYTFNYERTFLDRRASVEVRVPFTQSLSSRIDYSVGGAGARVPFVDANGARVFSDAAGNLTTDMTTNAVANTPLNAIAVTPTPGSTFGSNEWEMGNVTLIMKALFYETETLFVSGGVSLTAPTARDSSVRITDYLGFTNFNNVDTQRVREVKVQNETWGLSPFIAALYVPNDRFFAQGFLQFDLPLNESRADYRETIPRFENPQFAFTQLARDTRTNVRTPPFAETRRVREQVLMHADVGVGYWLMRDTSRPWITGFAPTAELHYTTTLNNAGLAQFSPDPSVVVVPTGRRDNAGLPIINETFPATGPVAGNRRNRLDIINLTLGGTFMIAEQASLATAVALPLRTGDNRTFDWEMQVQFNYFLGRPR